MQSEAEAKDVEEKPVEALVEEYLASMNEKEKIAYVIAKDHLGTSFNILKSIGYLEWLSKR
uniref:Uncharacterized protein n=1 Tax=viral metagenome TaxID=1070528 RepID=A0A6C0BC69_9ZZZZ